LRGTSRSAPPPYAETRPHRSGCYPKYENSFVLPSALWVLATHRRTAWSPPLTSVFRRSRQHSRSLFFSEPLFFGCFLSPRRAADGLAIAARMVPIELDSPEAGLPPNRSLRQSPPFLPSIFPFFLVFPLLSDAETEAEFF